MHTPEHMMEESHRLDPSPGDVVSDPLEALDLVPPTNGTSRSSWAYSKLKELIVHNRLPVGYQALEAELAARLGVSRTPMHEALLRLQAGGLVELTPRRGVRVLPLGVDDVREIYQLLVCIEATAAELMAGQGLRHESSEIMEMTEINERMRLALEVGDLDLWVELDETFHRLLVQNSGNGRLVRLVETLRDQSHRASRLTIRYRVPPVDSYHEHSAVLGAIVRQDGRVAYEIQSAHRRRAMLLFLQIMGKHRLAQL